MADRQEIAHLIAQHSRGIDRGIAAMFSDVYAADGWVDYGFFDGTAGDFADVVTQGDHERPVSLHRPSNVWIKFTGPDKAISETYVVAYTTGEDEDGGTLQTLIGGRYLDTHERRDGAWRMVHRLYVMDWNTNWAATGSAAPDFDAGPYQLGRRQGADPGNNLLNEWGVTTPAPAKGDKTMDISEDLQARAEVAFAKQDIHELIMAQARGVDRGDVELLLSLFHPGATVEAGLFNGSAEEFCHYIVDATADMKAMAHAVANEWVQVDGDVATAESYVLAFTSADVEGQDTDTFTGGRYVDRYERRDGVWKCTQRTFVLDWQTGHPSSDMGDTGMLATLQTRGGRKPDDPIYEFWKD